MFYIFKIHSFRISFKKTKILCYKLFLIKCLKSSQQLSIEVTLIISQISIFMFHLTFKTLQIYQKHPAIMVLRNYIMCFSATTCSLNFWTNLNLNLLCKSSFPICCHWQFLIIQRLIEIKRVVKSIKGNLEMSFSWYNGDIMHALFMFIVKSRNDVIIHFLLS